MRWPQWACLALGLALAHASLPSRDYEANDYFVLQLEEELSPSLVAQRLGATYEGPVGELKGHYTFSAPKGLSQDVDITLNELRRRRRKRSGVTEFDASLEKRTQGLDGVLWSQKQEKRKRLVKRIPPPAKVSQRQKSSEQQAADQSLAQQEAIQRLDRVATELNIKDPIFKEQWHLFNPIQLGHDLNVTRVWLDGITGKGVISAVIDDGLDLYSDDLKPNYYANGSWDFNDPGPDPKPRLSDDKHGTRCAGEIAAARNDVCGVGMAYDSKIAGIRILSKPISDEDEAASINYHYQENQIYSCSWGPPDDGRTMEGPSILIQKAMVNGVQNGRGGLGSVFVFAAGNGANNDDNCNFDGYTNSIYSITVGAIDRAGDHPYYSESCSAQLVVTYSSGHNDAIHTTDVGKAKCNTGHGGTSAAGPLMVGTAALAMSARPDLTWRDLQYLCVLTAVPVHEEDGQWQKTAIGKKYSHMYGYGKIDAYAYVQMAKDWENVKPQAWWDSPWIGVQHAIPEGDQGLAASFKVTQDMLSKANLERLEHVTITMNVEHTRRGDLSVDLKSPSGVVSHIATARRNDAAREGYYDWTFMSVAHWGEKGVGTWTIIVKDTNLNENNGTFVDWRMKLWGEAIDASIQKLHPMPDEHDDDHETAQAIVTTTSISANPASHATPPPGNPTDHIDRPTKPQAGAEASPTKPGSTTATSAPDSTTSDGPDATHTYSEGFLPSFFPTFGVSKKTQIWIYGSIGVILVFCIGLGVYFLVQRRKRMKNSRDGYEFEMVNTDDDDDAARRRLTGGRARRGGELYDAFAAGSDDDDGGTFSDDESDRYEDTPSGSSGSGGGNGGGGRKEVNEKSA